MCYAFRPLKGVHQTKVTCVDEIIMCKMKSGRHKNRSDGYNYVPRVKAEDVSAI